MEEGQVAAPLLGSSPIFSKKNLLKMGELSGVDKISVLASEETPPQFSLGSRKMSVRGLVHEREEEEDVPTLSRRFSMWGSRKSERADDDKKTENEEGGGESGKLGFLRKMSSVVMGGNSGKANDDDKSSTHGGHSSHHGGHSSHHGDSKKGGRFGWFGFGHSVREEDSDVSSIPGVAFLPGIEEKRGELDVRKFRRMKKRGLGEEFWKQRQDKWKDLPLPDLMPSIVSFDANDANAQLDEDPIVQQVEKFLLNGHSEAATRDLLLRLLIQEEIKARDAHKYSLVTLSGVRKVPPPKPHEPPIANMVIAEAMAVAGSMILDMDDKPNVSRISVGDSVSATSCIPDATTVVAVNTVAGTVTISATATASRVLMIKFITPMKAHPINYNKSSTSNGTTSEPPEI